MGICRVALSNPHSRFSIPLQQQIPAVRLSATSKSAEVGVVDA